MSESSRRAGLGVGKIFGVPALIATLSCAGLLAALFDDGAHDVIAWMALALPVCSLALAMCRARRAVRRNES